MNFSGHLQLVIIVCKKLVKPKPCPQTVKSDQLTLFSKLNYKPHRLLNYLKVVTCNAEHSKEEVRNSPNHDQILQEIPASSENCKKKQQASFLDINTTRNQFGFKPLNLLQTHWENIKSDIVMGTQHLINVSSLVLLSQGWFTNYFHQSRCIEFFYVSTALNQKSKPTSSEAGFGTNVIIATDETFETLIVTDTPTFVMFYASWCGHCTTTKPPYSKVATALKGKVNLVAIDASENMKTADFANITTLPKFKLYKNGLEQAVFDGNRTYEDILEFLTIQANLK